MSVATRKTIIRDGREAETVHEETGIRLSAGRVCGHGRARNGLAAAVVAVLAGLLMAISAAPALASWGIHQAFGEAELGWPTGIAVDESGGASTGDVYVGNFDDKGVSKFDASGTFLSPPSPIRFQEEFFYAGVAVNPTNGNVYAVNAQKQQVEIFDLDGAVAGTPIPVPGSENLGGFTVVQIAADANGNVYVPSAHNNEIQVFDEKGEAPSGDVASTISGSGEHALNGPEGVAIGPEGNVWVADTGDGRIEEFDPNGTFIEEIASPHVRAVALDASGDVFASIGGATPYVNEYSTSGTMIDSKIGEGVLSNNEEETLNGIVFDRANGILYVANGGGNAVERFTSLAAVSTEPPSNVAKGTATLTGTISEVEPGASVASCKFEYGPTTAYGSSVPCLPGGPYTTSTSVSATVSGLSGDTHYRIVVAGADGEEKLGDDQVFGPPDIDSQSAEAAVTTATLRADATVIEAGESTCKEAQYVAEQEYDASGFADARSVPCSTPIGSTPGEYGIETDTITGLQPDTVYRFRFLTTNQDFGTAAGPSGEFATFGIVANSFAFQALGQSGEPLTQAGAHPDEWTDTFRLNTSTHMAANGVTVPLATDANPRDIITELPPGLIGNPDATPKCDPYDVAHADCSGASQVGTMQIYTSNQGEAVKGRLNTEVPVPIYNLVPPKGLAAQFGARFNGFVTVHIDSRVRTGGNYGVTAEVLDSSAGEGLVIPEVTLWGVPAAESHDPERYCPEPGKDNEVHFGEGRYSALPCTERGPLVPFLSNPTSCGGEREASMSVEPWQEGEMDGHPVLAWASTKMPAITGCGKLGFKPSMTIAPTSKVSDSPTGLDVELKVPQNEDPEGFATADLKEAKVVLPAGMTVNPSSAGGLTGCPLLTGAQSHAGQSGIDLENSESADCPNASKVGSVHIKTPLLEEELEGGVYVAQQNANPFKSLLALYIAAEAPERGVVVKLAGHVEPNATTGQLTTTFDENPQLPFETLKLDFFGGERAPLATPRTCGSYQPSSLLEPYSHQGAPGEEGTPNAEPSIDPFEITSGPGGLACGSSAFVPAFEAGTESNQAGSYSPFTMTLTRKDGEQHLSTVNLTMPPGISGMLSSVPLCSQAQAEANACPVASQVGHVVVQAGVGSEPITLPEVGKSEDPVYLLSKTEGAPFGLAIVVHPEAGPFNLEEGGKPIIVLSKLTVNPRTAQVSVASKAMPTMLQGIPVDVKAIHVVIDRKGFMFNPTSCEPLSVAGSIGSVEGASANVTSRFQAAGCRGLAFAPKLTASTSAHVSRRDGASLHVKIAYPKGSVGTDANLRYVQVKLPHGLPSRLETLKQACTAHQFAANPAGCPAASVVGHAVVHTPVLPVPLTGPAYFVGHGGAQWPELVMVLQGDGVTVQLNGSTFISKGVTSSTFAANPDVPFSSFELTLPRGPYSALSFNGSLCTTRQNHQVVQRHMTMPTVMIGQNGAKIEAQTPVDVEGCSTRIETRKISVKGDKAAIVVRVPYAGKLTAEGKRIESTKTISKKAGQTTLTVKLTPRTAEKLRHSHRNQIRVEVHLAFQAKHHQALHEAVAVTLR